MRTATEETDSMPWGIRERTLCLTPDPTPNGTTKPRGHQVPRVEGDKYAPLPPTMFYRDAPSALKLPSNTIITGWVEQCLKRRVGPVGKTQGRPTRHFLEPVTRRADSEGSLSLMLASNLEAKRSRMSGKIRRDQERTGKVGGREARRLLYEGG